jgi:Protein of unknown function (DUF2971)
MVGSDEPARRKACCQVQQGERAPHGGGQCERRSDPTSIPLHQRAGPFRHHQVQHVLVHQHLSHGRRRGTVVRIRRIARLAECGDAARGRSREDFPQAPVEDYKFERIKARFEFYSASFGQKDDPEQWTDYAAGGSGIALGLAPAFFGLAKADDFKPEEKIFLGKVSYGEAEAKVRHAGVIDSAISVVKQAYREALLLKAEDEDEFLRHMAAEMYVEILWNSVTTKASKWSHQNETRLLALNDLRNPQLEIRNAEVRPRVELPQPLLSDNISEIMIGPKADEGANARVRAFLDKNGLSKVPITAAGGA